MGLTFEPLGKYVRQVDERNTNMVTESVLGINIDKYFMPSVANVIGTDLSNYKLLRKGRFACNPMHVGRDGRLPVSRYTEDTPAIVSPAYLMFEIIDENEIEPEYLMLCFRRPDFDRMCWFRTDASVRGGITWDDVCALTIPVPSLPEQRKIVHDYQVITDRIELLRKMNEKLEEQAELLFSDFMSSSNGKEGVFSDVIKIMGGGTPSTAVNEYWNGDIPFFTPGDINGSFCFSTDKTLTDKGLANCSSKKYPIKTTFITCRGTVGKVALAGVPMAMNQTCYALTGIGDYPDYFVYEFVKYFVNSIKRKANGGVFDAITTKDFETEKVDVPTEGQALDFEKDAEPIFAVIFNNQREMFTLEHIRTLTMTSMIQKGA